MVSGISGDIYRLNSRKRDQKQKKSKEEFGKRIHSALDQVESDASLPPYDSVGIPSFIESVPLVSIDDLPDPAHHIPSNFNEDGLKRLERQLTPTVLSQKALSTLKNFIKIYTTTSNLSKKRDILLILVGACKYPNPPDLSLLLMQALKESLKLQDPLEHRQYAIIGLTLILTSNTHAIQTLFRLPAWKSTVEALFAIQLECLTHLIDTAKTIILSASISQFQDLLSGMDALLLKPAPLSQKEAVLDLSHSLAHQLTQNSMSVHYYVFFLAHHKKWGKSFFQKKYAPSHHMVKQHATDTLKLSEVLKKITAA